MVFGALALLSFVTIKTFQVSRAAAPKGTKSCRTQGESVHLSIRSSMRGWLGAPRVQFKADKGGQPCDLKDITPFGAGARPPRG